MTERKEDKLEGKFELRQSCFVSKLLPYSE